MRNQSIKRPPKHKVIEEAVNAKSIALLFGLLKKAEKNLTSIPEEVVKSCKNQGGLAACVIDEIGKSSMSLNTLKKHAEQNINIGWKQFDYYRKAVFKKYQKMNNNENKPARNSKYALEMKIDKLQEELENKKNQIIQFSDRYDDLLSLCRVEAKRNSTLMEKLRIHLSKYDFLDNRPSFPGFKIIDGGIYE